MPILKDPTPRYRLRYVTDDTVTWLLSPLHERTLCFDPKDDHFWSETPTPPRMIPFGDHARYGLDLYALAIEIIIIAACGGAWWLVWQPWHKKKDKDAQNAASPAVALCCELSYSRHWHCILAHRYYLYCASLYYPQ